MTVRVFVTGGTFDKEYDELSGTLYFRNTHVEEMLRRGRCGLDVDVETLMMVDSLEMTDAQRTMIVRACRECEEAQIVITHGTDTMVETARAIAHGVTRQDRRAHGRHGPLRLRQLGRTVQPRQRTLLRAVAPGRGLHRDERKELRVG